LLCHLQAGRQRDAAYGARRLVVLPAGADQVAARHGFDRQRLEAPHHEGAATHLGLFLLAGDHGFGVDAGQLVGYHVGQLAEPEIGHGGQHRALARDRVGQDHVEGGEAVGGDDQQLVVADGVDVAHLAAPSSGRLLMLDSNRRGVVMGMMMLVRKDYSRTKGLPLLSSASSR
jgi:hypothetical protein